MATTPFKSEITCSKMSSSGSTGGSWKIDQVEVHNGKMANVSIILVSVETTSKSFRNIEQGNFEGLITNSKECEKAKKLTAALSWLCLTPAICANKKTISLYLQK